MKTLTAQTLQQRKSQLSRRVGTEGIHPVFSSKVITLQRVTTMVAKPNHTLQRVWRPAFNLAQPCLNQSGLSQGGYGCLSRSQERSALSKQGMCLHTEWTTRTDPAICFGLSEEAMDSSYWSIHFFFLLHSRASDQALSVIEV